MDNTCLNSPQAEMHNYFILDISVVPFTKHIRSQVSGLRFIRGVAPWLFQIQKTQSTPLFFSTTSGTPCLFVWLIPTHLICIEKNLQVSLVLVCGTICGTGKGLVCTYKLEICRKSSHLS